jgi:hypothetical protein
MNLGARNYSPTARNEDSPKLDFRFTEFSEVGLLLESLHPEFIASSLNSS